MPKSIYSEILDINDSQAKALQNYVFEIYVSKYEESPSEFCEKTGLAYRTIEKQISKQRTAGQLPKIFIMLYRLELLGMDVKELLNKFNSVSCRNQ